MTSEKVKPKCVTGCPPREKVKPKCPTCGLVMCKATTFGEVGTWHWYCPLSLGGCGHKETSE